jgi:hypothetical protein
LTIASTMNPSAANGSMSGQTAAKWCELRIATAAMPWLRALSRSSGALAARRAAQSRCPRRSRPAQAPHQQSMTGRAVALGRHDGLGDRLALSADTPCRRKTRMTRSVSLRTLTVCGIRL